MSITLRLFAIPKSFKANELEFFGYEPIVKLEHRDHVLTYSNGVIHFANGAEVTGTPPQLMKIAVPCLDGLNLEVLVKKYLAECQDTVQCYIPVLIDLVEAVPFATAIKLKTDNRHIQFLVRGKHYARGDRIMTVANLVSGKSNVVNIFHGTYSEPQTSLTFRVDELPDALPECEKLAAKLASVSLTVKSSMALSVTVECRDKLFKCFRESATIQA